MWLLRIMLQWTWDCKYLIEIVISLILDVFIEEKLLGQITVLFLFFENHSPYYFHNGYMDIHPHRLYKESSALWLLVILPANPQLQHGSIAFTLNLANALRIKQLWMLSLSFWVLPYPRCFPKNSVLFLFVL